MLLTCLTAIPLGDFYPYGSKVGDGLLGRIDNGFGPTVNDTLNVCVISIISR